MPRTPRWTPLAHPFQLSDVAALGVTPVMIAGALRVGRIVRLDRGVYIAAEHVAADPVGRHLQQARAVQLRHPRAIASHGTAALAWGLDLADERATAGQAPSFILPADPGLRSMRRPAHRMHVRDLPTEQRVIAPDGLRITTAARAAVDVAADLRLPEALVSLDSFVRIALREAVGTSRLRRAYEDPRLLARARDPLLDVAEAAATQFTRQWLEEVVVLADARRESPLESLSFGHMRIAGLPVPELQARIATPVGEFWGDFLWRAWRVVGEADGEGKYRGDEEALVREKRRQEALEQLGFVVVRWTYPELVRGPQRVLDRILRALDARS